MDTREVIEAIFAAWSRGESGADLFAEDFRWHDHPQPDGPADAFGRDEVVRRFAGSEDGRAPTSMEILEMAVQGDTAAVIVRHAAREPGGDLLVELTMSQRWVVRDGRARECVVRDRVG